MDHYRSYQPCSVRPSPFTAARSRQLIYAPAICSATSIYQAATRTVHHRVGGRWRPAPVSPNEAITTSLYTPFLLGRRSRRALSAT